MCNTYKTNHKSHNKGKIEFIHDVLYECELPEIRTGKCCGCCLLDRLLAKINVILVFFFALPAGGRGGVGCDVCVLAVETSSKFIPQRIILRGGYLYVKKTIAILPDDVDTMTSCY